MLSLSGLSFLDNVDTSRRDLILIALDPGEVRVLPQRTPPRNSSCYSGVRYARPPAPVLDPGCAGGITQEKRNREHLDG